MRHLFLSSIAVVLGVICQAQVSPKLRTGYANPLTDHHFMADPTSVEYEGRLYVYATNDHEQYDKSERENNSYEKIGTLAMLSTDDMVNWTYHGVIPVSDLASYCNTSWAPSVISREEPDGKTHFYLYYALNGGGTGVLTSTSPTGPWTCPLDKALVSGYEPEVNGCAFDPGTVIDDNGVGWIAVGGGQSRLARLGKDLISIDSKFVDHHPQNMNEANELNFIGGKYVYTYCLDWEDHSDWKLSDETPGRCCMGYMTSTDPLDPESWHFENTYLNNPGDFEGFNYTNNHTHLQKFQGKWYIIYHSEMLEDDMGMYQIGGPEGSTEENRKGGFRSLMIDEIEVDEQTARISPARITKQGVSQTHPLNPYVTQQAETTAATEGVLFTAEGDAGNMVISRGKAFGRHSLPDQSVVLVRGVDFGKGSRTIAASLKGNGSVEVKCGSMDSEPAAVLVSEGDGWHMVKTRCRINGKQDLYFILKGDVRFDKWQCR